MHLLSLRRKAWPNTYIGNWLQECKHLVTSPTTGDSLFNFILEPAATSAYGPTRLTTLDHGEGYTLLTEYTLFASWVTGKYASFAWNHISPHWMKIIVSNLVCVYLWLDLKAQGNKQIIFTSVSSTLFITDRQKCEREIWACTTVFHASWSFDSVPKIKKAKEKIQDKKILISSGNYELFHDKKKNIKC